MKITTVLPAVAVAMAFSASANAALIALSDPSLETGFSGTQGTPESGWFSFGGATAANQVDGGFWNIGNPDGPNAAYLVSYSDTDGGNLYQTVELDAGITYTLTAGVAQSASVDKNNANFQLVFFNQAFSAAQAAFNGIVANQSGSFVDYSVDFTPATSGTYHVGLRNRGHIPGSGANNESSTVFFDNVRLVPEPSSTALLGLGGIALLLRRRK